jgi:small subunit ribosomal protein S17e
LEKYPDQFVANDFRHNKEKVKELSNVNSNLLRNRIAGYITRMLAANKEKKDQPISE